MNYIKNLFSRNKQEQIILFFVTLVLLLTVLPMLYISKYNVISTDDYAALIHRGNYLGVLGNAIEYAKYNYLSWRGTYYGIWLTALLLQLFGESHYGLISSFVIILFTLFTIISICSILKSLFQSKLRTNLIISFVTVIVSLLSPPSAAEGFYWNSSSLLYAHGWAFYLIIFAILIKMCTSNDKSKTLFVICFISNIIVGGSNYPVGITLCLIYLLITLYAYINKLVTRRSILILLFVYYVSFVFNMLAPGNYTGLNEWGGRTFGPLGSILYSFVEAAKFIFLLPRPHILILFAMLAPFIFRIINFEKCSFRLPVVFTLISGCVYASHFTPNIYICGLLVAYRSMNIYYWAMIIFLLSNEIYWIGWIKKKIKIKPEKETSYILPGWIVGGILVIISLLWLGPSNLSPVSVFLSVKSGEAQGYVDQYQERLKLLEDPTIQDVVLEHFFHPPYMLFYKDIGNDPNDEFNVNAAKYYGKNSVIVN